MWFSVAILVKAVVEGASQCPIWDESIYMVDATSEQDAYRIALEIGKDSEHEYIGGTGKRVAWTFDSIEKIYPIESHELKSGVRIFNRGLKEADVLSMRIPFPDHS
ncbi:MAG TPA: DUF4288 domain-containing protein [Verrucomicrobiae bacterium]|nr:DUF4288 domain-containing protein [Verrucomicrobiae bacterium]